MCHDPPVRGKLAIAGAVVGLLAAVQAETPLGIGNGVVPDLVGLDECTAARKLEERGLRWRFGDRAPVGGRPAACVDGELLSVADPVLAQRPSEDARPGRRPVVLETACTREGPCSRLGRYEFGRP